MRKKTKSMLAILLAASMMSSLCSLPASAAEISSDEEAIAVESLDVEAADEEEVTADIEAESEEPEVTVEEDAESEEAAQSEELDVEDEFADAVDVGDEVEESYSIWVNGEQVTSSNMTDVLGDKKVSYDPVQHILTLNNVDISDNIRFDETDFEEPVTLKLIGDNKIVNLVSLRSKLTVTGDGTLNMKDMSGYILSSGDLVIDGAKIKIEDDGQSALRVDGNLTIQNGADVNIVENGSCMGGGQAPQSLLMAQEAEESKAIMVKDSTLKLESKVYFRSIEVNRPVIFENSTVDLIGGIETSEYVTIKNSKVNIKDSDVGLYSGVWADKLQISNNSEVNVSGVGRDGTALYGENGVTITGSKVTAVSPEMGSGIESYQSNVQISEDSDVYVKGAYVAIYGKSGVDISNSKIQAEGTGRTIDCLEAINIKDSIVLADSYVEDGLGKNSISAYDNDENDNDIIIKKDINISNSWVESAEDIYGNQNVSNSVVFVRKDGRVTGNAIVPGNVEVRKDRKLTVAEPATLTIPTGRTLNNNGAVNAYCTSIKGTVTGTVPAYTHGQLTGWKTDSASHWKECSRCSEKFQTTAHTYSDWNITKAAGRGVTGAKERSCTVCGIKQNEKIDAISVMGLGIKGGKNSVRLRWSKVTNADGYMIYAARCGNAYQLKKIIKANTCQWTQKKLKKGTYYKYYVVAYKMVDGQRQIIGRSSDMHTATTGKGYGYAKKITVKKSSVALTVGKSYTIKASVKNTTKKVRKHTANVRYISTNADVAAVDSKGTVIAKAKGTCHIYCYAMNGLTQKVKITVK